MTDSTKSYRGVVCSFKGVIPTSPDKSEKESSVDFTPDLQTPPKSMPTSPKSSRNGAQRTITLLPLPVYTKLEKSSSEPNVFENKEMTPRNSFDDAEDDLSESLSKKGGSRSEGHLVPEENAPAPELLPEDRSPVSVKVDQTHIDEGRKRLTEGGDCRMIPDYSSSGVMNGQQINQEGLILPRKPHNPCLDSIEKQNLHRELLFNQKIGKSVLNQKSELQRALEKHKESQSKKEMEQQRLEGRTPFERLIEERAKRLETLEKQSVIEPQAGNKPEFLRVHAKLQAKMNSK